MFLSGVYPWSTQIHSPSTPYSVHSIESRRLPGNALSSSCMVALPGTIPHAVRSRRKVTWNTAGRTAESAVILHSAFLPWGWAKGQTANIAALRQRSLVHPSIPSPLLLPHHRPVLFPSLLSSVSSVPWTRPALPAVPFHFSPFSTRTSL